MLKYLKKNIYKKKKTSVLLQQLTIEINNKIYFLQEPKKSASAVALACKISYKIQLKSLKHLPPQSLACEVYLKRENEVKGFLPQSRRTRKYNATKRSKVFSRSHFCAKSTIKCIKTKYNMSCCSQSSAKSQIKRKKSK